MIVRVARPEDAPAMARVMVDTFLAAHRGHMPEEAWQKRKAEWTYEVSETGWARALREIDEGANSPECLFVAATDAGEIVGLTMGTPSDEEPESTGVISCLYVRQSHQRHGLGRRLVQAVAEHLAKCEMTALTIGCLAANKPARRFYEALGGQIVAEREFDEEGVMLPEVIYGWTDIRKLAEAGAAE